MSADALNGLQFGPPPDWIVEHPILAANAEGAGAVHTLMIDDQVDRSHEAPSANTWSRRVIQQPVQPEGLGTAATVRFVWDPAYQHVVVHRVRVIRDGTARDWAVRESFDVLRRETNLERRTLDGHLTANLQIPDVRVGDLVETWATWVGTQPLLAGLVRSTFVFGWHDPVAFTATRVRHRADDALVLRVIPDDGPVALLHHEQAVQPDGAVITSWTGTHLPTFRYERMTPPGWRRHLGVEVAYRTTWTAVAERFVPYYALPSELSPALAEVVARLRALPSPEARAVAALNLVQRDVRYLAVNLGDGGHVPRPPAAVWERRYGDCKDMSLLLCTLLVHLGVDAVPALVSTTLGDAVGAMTPSATVFDHCVTRIRLDGTSYWVDPTQYEQAGTLAQIDAIMPRYGLPLTTGGSLEALPEWTTADVIAVEEVFTFDRDIAKGATLEVTTRYGAWRADALRSELRSKGEATIFQAWFAYYAKVYPNAVQTGARVVADDVERNVLLVEERYTLPSPWQVEQGRALFYSKEEAFASDLSVRPTTDRTQPLWLGRPRRITQRSAFQLPFTLKACSTQDSGDMNRFWVKNSSTGVAVDWDINVICMVP